MDLSKQHMLSTVPKAIQQIIFTRNLEQAGNTIVFFSLLKKQKELFWIFHKEP